MHIRINTRKVGNRRQEVGSRNAEVGKKDTRKVGMRNAEVGKKDCIIQSLWRVILVNLIFCIIVLNLNLKSEPQNIEYRMSKGGFASLSLFYKIDRIHFLLRFALCTMPLAMHFRLPIPNSCLRLPTSKIPHSAFRLPTSKNSDFPLPSSHFRIPTSHFHLPTSASDFPRSHFRNFAHLFRIDFPHFRLPTSPYSLPPAVKQTRQRIHCGAVGIDFFHINAGLLKKLG